MQFCFFKLYLNIIVDYYHEILNNSYKMQKLKKNKSSEMWTVITT